jgi:hypothetical protein
MGAVVTQEAEADNEEMTMRSILEISRISKQEYLGLKRKILPMPIKDPLVGSELKLLLL